MTDLTTAIAALVAKELGIQPDDTTPFRTLLELGADAIDKVSICLAIEDAYGIEITDDEITEYGAMADRPKTIRDLAALVKAKLDQHT